jgi:hypothetical protein
MGAKTRGIVFEADVSRDVMPSTVTLIDRSRWKNNGTWTNGAYTRLPSGLWVGSFNGTSTQINCGKNSSLNLFHLTLLAWVNPSTADENGYVIAKFSGALNSGYSLLWSGESDQISLVGGSATRTSNAVFTEYGRWAFCAIVAGGGNVYFYHNGVSEGTAAVVLSDSSASDFIIGNRDGGTIFAHYFDGYIARPRALNYMLTPGQILKIFNAERSLFGV